jgi:hypothetical protein
MTAVTRLFIYPSQPIQLDREPPFRDNLDPDSNVTAKSDAQSENHFSPKTSIDEKIIISIKPGLLNA